MTQSLIVTGPILKVDSHLHHESARVRYAVMQDEPGRGKKIGQSGIHRLAWLGTSPAKRVTSADTLDIPAGTAKGPTVMEVHAI